MPYYYAYVIEKQSRGIKVVIEAQDKDQALKKAMSGDYHDESPSDYIGTEAVDEVTDIELLGEDYKAIF